MLRAEIRHRRRGSEAKAGLLLAGHVLETLRPQPGAVVAGFWPLPGEIDPRPLMVALAGRGHRLALPVTGPRGTPLSFRLFRFGDPLFPGPFGTREPGPQARTIDPDWVLVPLLAFDRTGNRIGHGAGYYDATLAALRTRRRIVALGIAFAAQEVERVPASEGDERLDAVATETGLILT
ncbi:MAG: 5-formyltetrahydrofolate cyclo-ligase [Elioraea sp.]|nr:5-formyltetrahydrofolate cyclo-ligase [Elioraea sp.]